MIMWKGHQREAWDKIAVLRWQMMATGLSQPKQMPTMAELNPYRKDEEEDEYLDDLDNLGADIEEALR